MKPLDKKFLSLQFKEKIYSILGTEFQSFFEDIMEKAYLDFQKIRPFGNMGDGGNDGYRKDLGIYYQVYSPNVPKINERKAANKLTNDFEKLKREWDEISNIKEYYFVYNDQYKGSVQLLEEAITNLKINNPNIDFNIYLPKHLERDFFRLSDSDILGLGFIIDRRQAIDNAYNYFDNIKDELNRENALFAQKLLISTKDIISALNEEDLLLEYEILECRCLEKFEKIDEAKAKYENISKRFPKSPRPILYLAEIYLHNNDIEKNLQSLEKAEKIDKKYWLLELEWIIRKLHLGERININNVDENKFPDNPRIKASFYRLYGLQFEISGDQISADSFIEKAIKLNPNIFNNYLDKLSLLEVRMFSTQDKAQQVRISQDLLDLINEVETESNEYGDIGPRNKASLNVKKLSAFYIQENIPDYERTAKDTFELIINCYFDVRIEIILLKILRNVSLPENEFLKLLNYLLNSKMMISDALSNELIAQFNIHGTLYDDGSSFFEKINNQKYVEFINNIKNNDCEKVLAFINHNIGFAIVLANTLKRSPDLRRKIIENLPDDENIQKDKLWLLLNFDEDDFDEAFQILKELDLSNLSYSECEPMLQIAQEKKAWDFEIVILEKLLKKERDETKIFNLKFLLFNAFLNLNKFSEVIKIGEHLLDVEATYNYLSAKNQEALLANTIYAYLERGKIENEAYCKAKILLLKHPLSNPSFEFKAEVETEVYLNLNEAENALKAIIDGVKNKKIFSPQEYAKMHFLFVIIGTLIDLNLDSLEKVQEETFVKLSNKDQWYFIGNDNELDSINITKNNEKYFSFINKQLNDIVSFENKYGSGKYDTKIEKIYSIEKYILWQTVQNFQNLTITGDLDGVKFIETPQIEDTIDLQNLLNFFKDFYAKKDLFFDMYCKNPIPLAMLAINEVGIINAISRIQSENRGFINFCNGTTEELERQKEIARKIVRDKLPFYIDGTSAIFLTEAGILKKIYSYLPNLKVPQSVITLLTNITDKFRYKSWSPGYMGYAQGKITVSFVNKDRWDLIRSNFISSIKLIESNPTNISVISPANKADSISEREIPAELCDACILAQKENLIVLTDDYLYLKFNQVETKKEAPEYSSSWALLRVLFEEGYITFDEYLDYFGYLSYYRCRFLSINSEDIEKTVFGYGGNKIFSPENIRKLNFPLTLSEEYGVPFQVAFNVVGIFLFNVVIDNEISIDAVNKIFIEIINCFPTKMKKKEFGQRLIHACVISFEKNKPKYLCKLEDKYIYQKFDNLSQMMESYNFEEKPLTPLTEI